MLSRTLPQFLRHGLVRSLCTASTPTHTAESIMSLPSNKATRFVYLRTLPLRQQPELESDVDHIAKQIESTTSRICDNHKHTICDKRAAVHLHTTALAIGTHKVIASLIRDETRVTNIIRQGFGVSLLPNHQQDGGSDVDKKRPDYWIARAAIWFSWDRMKAIRKMTSNMINDFGTAFQARTVDQHDKEHTLVIEKCYYNQICQKEGLPHLTKIFCALDKAIYSPVTVESHGIQFRLQQTIADDNNNQTNISDDQQQQPKTCIFNFQKLR